MLRDLEPMLFHITPLEQWTAAQAAGAYRPASLEREGFVHLSTQAQWPKTLQRFFASQTGLVLLCVDETKLQAEVKWEPADADVFPPALDLRAPKPLTWSRTAAARCARSRTA